MDPLVEDLHQLQEENQKLRFELAKIKLERDVWEHRANEAWDKYNELTKDKTPKDTLFEEDEDTAAD